MGSFLANGRNIANCDFAKKIQIKIDLIKIEKIQYYIWMFKVLTTQEFSFLSIDMALNLIVCRYSLSQNIRRLITEKL